MLVPARESGDVAGNTCESQEAGYHCSAFVAEYRPDGVLTHLRELGVPDPDPDGSSHSSVIAAGPDGRIAVGGSFEGAIDLGDGPIEADPALDGQAWLAVYGPTPDAPEVD